MLAPFEQLTNRLAAYQASAAGKPVIKETMLPIIYAGVPLDKNYVCQLIAAVRFDNAEVLALMHAHADSQSLDQFALDIVERWNTVAQIPAWALKVAGRLGSTATRMELIAAAYKRAGLRAAAPLRVVCEALLAHNHGEALLCVYHLWQTAKWEKQQRILTKLLNETAKERQTTLAALGDYATYERDFVGTCYRYGQREFTFVLAAGWQPAVRDQRGQVHRQLPRANQRDAGALVPAALAAWQADKAAFEQVRQLQLTLLERAMTTERRWSYADFAARFVEQPFMCHLARLFVWGQYANEQLIVTFRPTDSGSLEDAALNLVTLPENAQIGIVHPLHMDADKRDAWGRNLRDDEILQPFAQIARGAYFLTPEEHAETRLTRLNHYDRVPGARFFARHGMVARGWLRLRNIQQVIFIRYFEGANITATLELRYTGRGSRQDYGIQHMAFYNSAPDAYADKPQQPLTHVPAMVISEVINDVLTCIQRVED